MLNIFSSCTNCVGRKAMFLIRDLEPYRNRKPKVTSKQRKRTRREIIAVSSDLI